MDSGKCSHTPLRFFVTFFPIAFFADEQRTAIRGSRTFRTGIILFSQQKSADDAQIHVDMPVKQPAIDPVRTSLDLDFSFVSSVPRVKRTEHGVRWELRLH